MDEPQMSRRAILGSAVALTVPQMAAAAGAPAGTAVLGERTACG